MHTLLYNPYTDHSHTIPTQIILIQSLHRPLSYNPYTDHSHTIPTQTILIHSLHRPLSYSPYTGHHHNAHTALQPHHRPFLHYSKHSSFFLLFKGKKLVFLTNKWKKDKQTNKKGQIMKRYWLSCNRSVVLLQKVLHKTGVVLSLCVEGRHAGLQQHPQVFRHWVIP